MILNYDYMSTYLKNLLPTKIDEDYCIDPEFLEFRDKKDVQKGVIAFKECLSEIYDYISKNTHYYDRTLNQEKIKSSHINLSDTYPILNNVKSVLFNIGYFGTHDFANARVVIKEKDVLRQLINNQGIVMKMKISNPKLNEVLDILIDCGFLFQNVEKENNIVVNYPRNLFLLLGLKVLSTLERNRSGKGHHNVFLRCDYRRFSKQDRDIDKSLQSTLTGLTQELQDEVLEIHRYLLDLGLTCVFDVFYMQVRYMYLLGKREVLTVSLSIESGYRLLIKTKKLEKYRDRLNHFPKELQETIDKGYGCNKKLYNQPCQMGCHGYSFLVDSNVSMIKEYIKEWIEMECNTSRKGVL